MQKPQAYLRKSYDSPGFTIVELLVIIVVIGVLASITYGTGSVGLVVIQKVF